MNTYAFKSSPSKLNFRKHHLYSHPSAQDESLALEASLESRHVAELSAVDSRLAADAQQEARQQAAGEVITTDEDAVAAALAANSLYGKSAASEHQVGVSPTLGLGWYTDCIADDSNAEVRLLHGELFF